MQQNWLNEGTALRIPQKESERAVGFEIVSRVARQLTHQDVGLLILSQSHLVKDRLSEEHFAAVDVYECGSCPIPETTLQHVFSAAMLNVLTVFPPDLAETPTDISTLENPAAWRYYLDGWENWRG
jgi:S-adenosylmethionine/arginine decarboxylase-like enzyme